MRERLAVERKRIRRTLTAATAIVGLGFSLSPVLPTAADAAGATNVPLQGAAAFAPRPIGPLAGLLPPAPPPAAYNAIVLNPAVLLTLGKALFWDTQVGNGNHQACASCHFHAGADSRTVNQLSPGLNMQPTGDNTFGNAAGKTGSGAVAGPNYALSAADYPFHRLANVSDRESAVLFDTNDVTSSQGAFQGNLVTSSTNNADGQPLTCAASPGAPFAITVNGAQINTRKVEPRNTPTNINAVLQLP